MTTSRVACTFCSVCLVVLSRTRRAGENTKMGGLELNTLKKLNGDRFGVPSALIVLAKAIGRGAMAVCKMAWIFTGDSWAGSKLVMRLVCSKCT